MSRRCALILVGFTLSACGGGAPSAASSTTISPGPSSVPSATAHTTTAVEPSLAPYPPVVSTPAGLLPPDSVARILAQGLRVRAGAPESPDHGNIVYSLAVGDLVLIDGGPLSYLSPELTQDGRGWYFVHVGGPSVNSYADGGIYGWVAEGENGLEWLAAEPVACLGPATLALLLAPPGQEDRWTTGWERLACQGGAALELEGVIETPCYEGSDTPLDYQPSFLANPDICYAANRVLVVDDIDAEGQHSSLSLELRFPPEFGVSPERGELVRVTGHFDDPASSTCSVTTQPGYDFVAAYDPEFLVLSCRERFVVTELTVIGHRDLAPLWWEEPQ